MKEVIVTTAAVRHEKAPVRSSPPTNQHPTFCRPMPFLSPNQQYHSTGGIISCHRSVKYIVQGRGQKTKK